MKKKFNKEERQAIIKKLDNIARKREEESWKEAREKYIPSETYKEIKNLLEQRKAINERLTNIKPGLFNKWEFQVNTDDSYYLNQIRDSEIKHLVTRYYVNASDMEVEIILADMDEPMDVIIENLLNQCLIK